MSEKIHNENIFDKNSNMKLDGVTIDTNFFTSLQNLQTLIKKESSLKELCKNNK